MLPPELQSASDAVLVRWRRFLRQDCDAARMPEILSTEECVSEFSQMLGLRMMQVYVDVRVEQAKANRPPCRCDAGLDVHRTTPWKRETPFGQITVRDPYLYCKTCCESGRPLHALLGTDHETWSLLVQEAAVDLAADESCGKAVAKLARHHKGVEMERTAALRMLHEHGRRARIWINNKLAKAEQVAGIAPALRPKGTEEIEVQFDGGMIPVATLEPIAYEEGQEPELTPVRKLPKRKKVCRWEEAKVGLVQVPGEIDRLYTVQPTSGLEKSFEDLFALACLKGWSESSLVRGVADGARYIRPRMEAAFNVGRFRFILDRPHCKEHLSTVGETLMATTGTPAQQWASDALDQLETGHVGTVLAQIRHAWETSGSDEASRDDTLRRELGYFRRNRDAVAYADYRDRGWSTASSEVESSHGHVVQCRLKIAGAWWHPDNIDHILAFANAQSQRLVG